MRSSTSPVSVWGWALTLSVAVLDPGVVVAYAQPSSRVFRIGILTSAWVPWHNQTQGFRDGLRDLGYVDGRNVLFEVLAGQGDSARLPRLADDLVRMKPDLLYCVLAL